MKNTAKQINNGRRMDFEVHSSVQPFHTPLQPSKSEEAGAELSISWEISCKFSGG